MELGKKIPELYEHQKEALRFIENKSFFALFMEMGTGKTRVVLEKAKLWYREDKIDCVLIVSSNAIKHQWIDEQIPLHVESDIDWTGIVWTGDSSQKFNREFMNRLADKKKLLFVSINIEAFRSADTQRSLNILFKERKVFFVVDESVKIKNGRWPAVRGKRGGAQQANAILDYSLRTPYKAILTGTPTPRSPLDLWSQFEFLKKDFFRMGYFLFSHKYAILISKKTQEGKKYETLMDEKSYNILKNSLRKLEDQSENPAYSPHTEIERLALMNGVPVKDILTVRNMNKYSPFKNLKELREEISSVTFYKNKSECLNLPDKIYEKMVCEMRGDQLKLYRDLKKFMYAEYKDKELVVGHKLTLLIRLQNITGGFFPMISGEGEAERVSLLEIDTNCKLTALLEDLESVPETTSIIVWSRFRAEIEAIHRRLTYEGYSSGIYYGGSSEDIIDQFKRREFQILVSNTLKGGEGLNLQVSSLQYFYSNDFSEDKRLQAEDRSHRIGQTNTVVYKDLVCKDTIDEHIYAVLKRKEDLINYFRNKPLKEILDE